MTPRKRSAPCICHMGANGKKHCLKHRGPKPPARQVREECVACGLPPRLAPHTNPDNRYFHEYVAPAPQPPATSETRKSLCRRCHQPGDCSCNVGEYIPGTSEQHFLRDCRYGEGHRGACKPWPLLPAPIPLPADLKARLESAMEEALRYEDENQEGPDCPVCGVWRDRCGCLVSMLRSALAELRALEGR